MRHGSLFLWLGGLFIPLLARAQEADTEFLYILPIVDSFDLEVQIETVKETVIQGPLRVEVLEIFQNTARSHGLSPELKVTYTDSVWFVYRYRIYNRPESRQPVIMFEIPRFSSKNGDVQVYFYRLGKAWREGASGPPVLDTAATAFWTLIHTPLPPGESLGGFVFLSPDLPDISWWYAEGKDLNPVTRGTPIITEGVDQLLDSVYYGKTPFGPGKYGRTVGPGPWPPSTPDSMFLHLLERVRVCHDLGWMSERAFRRLDSMIRHAYTQSYNFTAFDPVRGARNMNQIVRTIERLHNQGEIEDRAFYVLYYRARYVHQKFQEMIPQGKE